MDFWAELGITALLRLLKDKRKAKQHYPAIAKVFVKAEIVAMRDRDLQVEIEHQRKKEAGEL